MARDWEAQFREWAKPPGKTEQERCDNAVSAIRNAIKASDKLRARRVSVFVQGSYRNNTNVREDSDVDIGVLCGTTFLNDYPEGTSRETFGFSVSNYRYEQFKNEVEEALTDYFGRASVSRGDKAFDVHETSYHVEADVAAFFTHRRYSKDGNYHGGVALRTDREKRRIINWPEQHYENGVNKNKQTGTRFKSVVRILKALSNEMTENGILEVNIPGFLIECLVWNIHYFLFLFCCWLSFLIECLVWNIPNDGFQHDTYMKDVKAALLFLYEHTKTDKPYQNG